MKRILFNSRTLMTMICCAGISFSTETVGQTIAEDQMCSPQPNAAGTCAAAIGPNAGATGNNSISIGESSASTSLRSMSFGFKNLSAGDTSIVLGNTATTAGNSSWNMAIGHGTKTGVLLNNNISNSIMLGVNSNLATMFIQGAEDSGRWGRVGIGTTDPDGLLHLKDESTSNTDLIIERASVNVESRVVFQDETGAEKGLFRLTSSTDHLVMQSLSENSHLLFRVNDGGVNTEAMRVDGTTANVGIGVFTPGARLHVQQQVNGREEVARFSVGDAGLDWLQIRNGSPANGEFMPEIFGEVVNHSREALRLVASTDDDTGSDAVMSFVSRVKNNPPLPVVNRPVFEWQNSGSVRMRMLANGNLGIGTTTPSGTLDVNGRVFAVLSDQSVMGLNPVVYDNGTGELKEYTSTQNHKTQIENVQFDKEAFLSLRPVDFLWKEAFGGGEDVGLIAEEVEQLMPNMVNYSHKHEYVNQTTGEMLRDSLGNPVVDTTQIQPWGVDYRKISVYLLALAKEQDSVLGSMQDRLNFLESTMQNCCSSAKSHKTGTSTSEQNSAARVEKTNLNVYPNPNDGNFTIDYSLPEGEAARLFLVMVSGEKMLLSSNVRSAGKENFNISGPSGVYQVILEGSGGEILKNVKVVIAR